MASLTLRRSGKSDGRVTSTATKTWAKARGAGAAAAPVAKRVARDPQRLQVVGAAIGGAALVFLLDRSGRIVGFFSGRRVEAGAADREAAWSGAKAVEPGAPQPNDQALTDAVMSQAFRKAEVPSGQVSVNSEMGVVYLRGELESAERIDRLVAAVKEVEGVLAVENLLHLPGEKAQAKQETEPETKRRVKAAKGS